MRSRPALTLAALAAAVASTLAGIAGAAPGGDSTSGNVTQFNTRIDWSARGTATGLDARGSARMTNTNADPNQVFAGDVTCMRVVGATATTPALVSVGVLLTDTPPDQGVFQSMIIHASDSGKSSSVPDTVFSFVSTAPPPPDGGCPAPFLGSPVARGEVVVNNALP